MSDRNPFGGLNPISAYVPMSDLEREAISRLIEAGDLMVLIHGWGYLETPSFVLGDAQVMVPMTLTFDRPATPIPVSYFDLELRTRGGVTLFRERQPTLYGGLPIMVGAGTEIQMIWHIGIQNIDPNLVKSIVPGAIGLTSRVLDKDTGRPTLVGNMKLEQGRRRLLENVRKGEARIRADKASQLRKGER